MKRRLYIPGLAIAILTLVQCSVEEQEALIPSQETSIPFEVVAGGIDTKTVNEGKSTTWEVGDAFSLFHKARRTAQYTSDGAFVIDEASTGHAKGTIAQELTETMYDWYSVYPAYSDASDPTSIKNVIVGSTADLAQVQTGYGSTSHIAGNNYPVIGKAESVASTEIPSLSFAHATALVVIKVTNNLDEEITITSASLKAPENIVGLFDVDIVSSPATFNDVAGSVSAEATVSVTGGTALAKAGSAVLYLGLKPFTAASGSSISLTVNVSNASGKTWSQTKTVTLSAETSFEAGKIKTLNFGFDEPSSGGETGPVSYKFQKTASVTNGGLYVFIYSNTTNGKNYVAKNLPSDTSLGFMEAEEVIVENDVVILPSLDYAKTFTLQNEAYAMNQMDGKYLYSQSGSSGFYLSGTLPDGTGLWDVSFASSGKANIMSNSLYVIYKNSAFGMYSSGNKPYLYEYVGTTDGSATDILVGKYVYGVYDYNDVSWTYAIGTGELSWRYYSDSITFRIIDLQEEAYTEVSGLPLGTPSLDDVLTLTVTRFEKGSVISTSSETAKVLKVEDGDIWLRAESGVGLIVNNSK